MTWHEEWPAKGLLAECRLLWDERTVLKARITELEAQLALGPTWQTQSGVTWRLDKSPEDAQRKPIA